MAKKIKDPRRVGDFWTRKARAEDYPARSVYKLIEVDEKYGLLRAGNRVLDLGCAPGSWTRYAAQRVGPQGLVVGLDRQEPEIVPAGNVKLVLADILETGTETWSGDGPYDVVLSDMAPRTTGAKLVDQARSLELARAALAVALAALRPGGSFLFKIFQGPEADDLFKELTAWFQTVRRVKPKSSRSFSPEIFGLATGLKRGAKAPGGG